jgi:hypothetical protein
MKKRLFIMVEGEDDVRFFGRIIKPLFAPRYDSVEIVPYACIRRDKVNKFLQSVVLMKNDYIFVADIDYEHSVRDKKQILYSRFSNLDGSSVVIVIREIESWYYAGISGSLEHEPGIAYMASTDDLTKEDFNARIPKRFDSRIDFMFEILKSFSLETAARKNQSFHFFVNRYYLADNPDR